MEITYVVQVLSIVFFAALIQSIAGFGYALLAAPLLTLIMEPKEIVTFLLFSGMYLNAIIFFQVMKDVCLKDIKYLFIGNTVGIIPGMLILRTINVPIFKLFIGVILLFSVATIISKFTWKIKNVKREEVITGFVAGLLGASTTMGAPPMILHMFNRLKDKAQIRARLVAFFTLGTLMMAVIFVFSGTIEIKEAVGLPVYALPVVMFASALGKKIFFHINHELFEKLAICLILASSFTMLYGGYTGL